MASLIFEKSVNIGFFFLVLPGIAAIVLYSYYLLAIVIDGNGPLACLEKSFKIAKDNIYHTIKMNLIIFLLLIFVYAFSYFFKVLFCDNLLPIFVFLIMYFLFCKPVVIATSTVAYMNLIQDPKIVKFITSLHTDSHEV